MKKQILGGLLKLVTNHTIVTYIQGRIQNKVYKFDSWEEAMGCWFEKKALGQFKTIEVLDRKKETMNSWSLAASILNGTFDEEYPVIENKDRFKKFTFGGREVTPIHLLLLLGEMEGVYQHLKYMGFEEDMNSMEELKKKYYKLYFQKVKEEKGSK